MTRTVHLNDEVASMALGTLLAHHLPADIGGWLLLLQGDLGAGKSTVARALLRGLGQTGPIPSPTYTLIEPYEFPTGRVYHVDLYRLAGADELEFLGWQELDDGLRLVEWPERVPALFDKADVCLHLDYTETGRRASLRAASDRGAAWIATLPL